MDRILFVTPVSPFDGRSGAEQRSALMLDALSGLATVDVVWLTPGEETVLVLSDVEGIRCVKASLHGADGLAFRFSPKADFTKQLEKLLEHSLDEYSLIVGRYVWGLCQLKVPPLVRTLVDLDDYRFRLSNHYGWSLSCIAERSRKMIGHVLSRRTLSRFSGAFVASTRDLMEASASATLPVCYLPNVASSRVSAPSVHPVGKRVLFVGSLWYGPNVQGVEWLLRKVWPRVREKVHGATLLLVGAAPLEVRNCWERIEGVSAPGFVDDLATAYAQSSVVVVPIQAGGGSNIKVLEALQYKRPCVVSSFVASAFEPHLQPRVHFRVADTISQFVDEICEVLESTQFEVDVELARQGHEAVLASFLPESFIDTVRSFAAELPLEHLRDAAL